MKGLLQESAWWSCIRALSGAGQRAELQREVTGHNFTKTGKGFLYMLCIKGIALGSLSVQRRNTWKRRFLFVPVGQHWQRWLL